ncbi:DUF4350 domain-containing protein [Myroides guanonis]|uniref:DUF4350 domain-containing protein n=1 Tax=Myroides guanonis TaxID=1150112 RepID=A0A1I3RZQ4_9FLAO|nr:DUF4350 domain-containing protein [Myroides guanonis]SFJ50767.1 hypothetical protein SAMN04487893_10946 [Myroides guanonis]
MNRTLVKYVGLFVAVLILIIGLEWSKPKRIDWHDTSMSINSKKPFGLYIFDQQIDGLLNGKKIHHVSSFSDTYLKNWNQDSLVKSSFLYINYDAYLSKSMMDTILNLANKGNSIFISSAQFDYNLLDTLGLSSYQHYVPEENTFSVWTTNQNLSKGRFNLKRAFTNYCFDIPDKNKINYEVLGFQNTSEKTAPNFLKAPFGDGLIYLHTQPLAFSNYNLLESNNHLYVENILSYIQTDDVYWVAKKTDLTEPVSYSLLRFILTNPSLKWSWYFFLIGLIVFICFTAKRKQRIIPIIHPVKNTSVEFTKTISGLYIETKDYKGIMQKQINQTLEEIRRKYRIDTRILNSDFIDVFESKSGIDRKNIQNWINIVKYIQSNSIVKEEEFLIKLNQATEKLWN